MGTSNWDPQFMVAIVWILFFSESEIGEFDDGLDDELMGDEEDRRRLEGE